MVMKMEFDDEADTAADGDEIGLTARLTKRIKKEPAKDKSKNTHMCYMQTGGNHFCGLYWFSSTNSMQHISFRSPLCATTLDVHA